MFVLNFTQSKTFICDKSFPFSRNIYLKRGATIFLLCILTPNLMGHGQGEHCMTPPPHPPPALPTVFHWVSGPSPNVVWGISPKMFCTKFRFCTYVKVYSVYRQYMWALIKIAFNCKYHLVWGSMDVQQGPRPTPYYEVWFILQNLILISNSIKRGD
jgi:hypothetical protein